MKTKKKSEEERYLECFLFFFKVWKKKKVWTGVHVQI
ncbi:hypothetical protein Patl1_13558 [Pistacia atlantica]|uniref:Uncharacterized protein n=1 Tax=Pistacia atlantica TaxID=434234 RepID=A0ACC1AVA4_9ROSI|nr:hypothetical protein Patl1_13558 [Pistacia atlantica]